MLSAPCSFWWAGLNFLTPRARNNYAPRQTLWPAPGPAASPADSLNVAMPPRSSTGGRRTPRCWCSNLQPAALGHVPRWQTRVERGGRQGWQDANPSTYRLTHSACRQQPGCRAEINGRADRHRALPQVIDGDPVEAAEPGARRLNESGCSQYCGVR